MPARAPRAAGRAVALALVMVVATVGCGAPDASPAPTAMPVQVAVIDDSGAAVDGAVFTPVVGADQRLDEEVRIVGPMAGVVRAQGYLDEPVVFDPAEPKVTVRLWRSQGDDGSQRRSMHFGGDVMLGRRYQDPPPEADTATARSDDEARAVVGAVAPLMAAADASFVNLETVVGELPADAAFDAKRFLLQSPPVVLAALQELGVDLVTLGNNHAYDWQDDGVAATLAALDGVGIAHVGAGLDEQAARTGRMLDVGGLQVGTLSYTSVDGDFVNDQLPDAGDPRPSDLPAEESWQYDERRFGHGRRGEPTFVPPADRRIGEAWQVFERIESAGEADDDELAALWAALTAPGAYPELQDWVARRGHGGAAGFRATQVADDVTALRSAGADLVVVQIHGGFQFSEVASSALRRNSRAAIDGGADLVVAHHPHVLQGFEWYDGHLIAHSLGNFLFDQDFLATFPSVILRTVWEGDVLLEARVVPLTIDRYRPVAVSGAGRDDVLRMLDARSALPASSDRVEGLAVGSVIDRSLDPIAVVSLDGTTGRIGTERITSTLTATVPDSGVVDLPACTMVRADDPTVQVGVDLFRWGGMDDRTANGVVDPGTHWVVGTGVSLEGDPSDATLRLDGHPDYARRARPVGRVGVAQHRWFDQAGFPADSEPAYSIDVTVLRDGTSAPHVRVVRYRVEDADPTVDPSSEELGEQDLELPLTEIGEWTRLHLDVTAMVSPPGEPFRTSAVMPYVVLPPGGAGVDIDDLRLMEWRSPTPATAGLWMPADAVRADPGRTVELTVTRCAQ